MKCYASLIALTVLALVFAGCSRQPPSAAASHPKIQNLGIVEISDGIPSHHDMGDGRVCIINPTIQKDGTILLAMRVEVAGKLLLAPRVITKPDQPFEFSAGDIGVGFTPHIVRPEDTDFVSLTNAMTAKSGEPVVSVDRLTGDNAGYFMVVTGSASDPHHYYARWFHSGWSINRIVK